MRESALGMQQCRVSTLDVAEIERGFDEQLVYGQLLLGKPLLIQVPTNCLDGLSVRRNAIGIEICFAKERALSPSLSQHATSWIFLLSLANSPVYKAISPQPIIAKRNDAPLVESRRL